MYIKRGNRSLIEEMVLAEVAMLNMRTPAMLDSGSMISIIPVGLFAEAKKTGFDIMSLELVEDSRMEPVYDASGNKMKFLGAVKAEVDQTGGQRSKVAFHIADTCEKELLMGTNSLSDLGV